MPRAVVPNTRRQLIVSTVEDMICGLLYYDRKEDADLPVGAIEETLRAGEVTSDEIATMVKDALDRARMKHA